MKIYTCYSPSHAPLLVRHFLPSVPDNFDTIRHEVPQHCPSATFDSDGWPEAMAAKGQMILQAITRETSPFVVCDADVRFYRLSPNDLDLGAHDIKYALDFPLSKRSGLPSYCAGFAVIRPSAKTLRFYQDVVSETTKLGREQKALRTVLARLETNVYIGHLPPDRFWSLPHPIPESYDLAIHHASWVKGVAGKMSALDAVRNLVETFRCS